MGIKLNPNHLFQNR